MKARRVEPAPERVRTWKRYPAYRGSGVEWLGEIPAHWEVHRIKHVARLESGHTPSRQHSEYWVDCTIPWFSLADVCQIRDGRREYVEETNEKISELGLANSSARLLPKGTVMLSRTASVGFSAIMAKPMATTQDFVDWVCGRKLSAEFLLYVFRSMKHELQRLTMGSTHQTIYMPDVARLVTPLPPFAEQGGIVSFIRRETASIDALIAKKERLIELLREKRSALITHAVTQGLDPNVAMKDSGIEWLGPVPAHWGVAPLKRALTRCDYGINESLTGIGDVRVLTMAHVQDGEIVLPDSGSISEVDEGLLLDHNDLLFNRTNSRELVGKVGIFRGRRREYVTFASYLVRMTSKAEVSPTYLNFLLNSAPVLGLARSMAMLSVNQANLNPTRYTQIQVPLPPRHEQDAIAEYIEEEDGRISMLATKVREAIADLAELRTSLISSAVTGKIDVREYAA